MRHVRRDSVLGKQKRKELIAVIECSDTDGIRLKEESTRIFYVILVNRKSN